MFKCDTLDPVCSIQEFVERIAEVKATHKPVTWYRGHSNCTFRLVPTIGREHKYNGMRITFTKVQEQLLLHRFRRRIYPHFDRILNEWEALLLARHHALPTRILDWSRLPLVALWFAVWENQTDDGDVWAMVRFDPDDLDLDILELSTRDDAQSPFTYFDRGPGKNRSPGVCRDAVKIIHPFYNSPRLVSQDGVFTLHSNPRIPLDEYAGRPFPKHRLDIQQLFRIPIPRRAKTTLVTELDTLAINRRTIFPDVDGIARHLWEVETMWRGEPLSEPTAAIHQDGIG